MQDACVRHCRDFAKGNARNATRRTYERFFNFRLCLTKRFARESRHKMSSELATAASVLPLCNDLINRAAQRDVRVPVTRRGEREPISRAIRYLVHQRDRFRCVWCGATTFSVDRRSGPLHVDHITPWSAGGSDRTDNLRTLCEKHNQYRSNWPIDLFYVALPIVRACDCCRVPGLTTKPADAFTVWCACRQHEGWASSRKAIL